jgi:hypothetical protein
MEHIEKPFIVANTLPVSLKEIHDHHIIPVFSKDNSPLISQSQIVETTLETISSLGYEASEPEIRVSHPIMGRVPEARFKPASELLPKEITQYYERMIFLLKIPKIRSTVNGQELSLVVGGIKSYSWDNLGRDHKASQHFKFFVGFQVWVCSNLCVSTDGAVLELKANSPSLIASQIKEMMNIYRPERHLSWLEDLGNYGLKDSQFAKFIGRCSMQPFSEDAPKYSLSSTQINSVVKGYYSDPCFSHGKEEISLWNLYNLITESNKGSYIDGFLDRNVSGERIVEDLRHSIHTGSPNWYLN